MGRLSLEGGGVLKCRRWFVKRGEKKKEGRKEKLSQKKRRRRDLEVVFQVHDLGEPRETRWEGGTNGGGKPPTGSSNGDLLQQGQREDKTKEGRPRRG